MHYADQKQNKNLDSDDKLSDLLIFTFIENKNQKNNER